MASLHQSKPSFIKRLHRPADAIAALILLGLLIWLAVFGVRVVRSLLLELEPAQRYTQEIRYEGSLVAVRSEYPVSTVSEGEFTPALAPGSRVREGDVVGSTQWESVSGMVTAGHTGLVYYDIDGWESVLTPAVAETIDWRSVVAGLEQGGKQAVSDTTAVALSSGRQVARIVDNLEAPYVFFYGSSLPAGLKEGDTLTLYLQVEEDGGDERRIDVTVELLGKVDSDTVCLWARVDNNAANVYQQRFFEAAIEGESISGISVPVSSLVQIEQDRFVYARVGGRLRLMPVEVLYCDEQLALVSGLEAGLQVVSNPERASVGQRVFSGR